MKKRHADAIRRRCHWRHAGGNRRRARCRAGRFLRAAGGGRGPCRRYVDQWSGQVRYRNPCCHRRDLSRIRGTGSRRTTCNDSDPIISRSPACKDGYYFEPSVAERIFDAMLAEEPSIRVLRRHRLTAASREDNRLREVVIANRDGNYETTVRAAAFVDATYEGDLLALAGAAYRLGREGRDEFDEPHAGVIYHDYESGRILPGSTGEADPRLPACTYRLCLSTDPANLVPPDRSPGGLRPLRLPPLFRRPGRGQALRAPGVERGLGILSRAF